MARRTNFMWTFEALVPLKLRTRTLGRVSVEPGQLVTWPDKAVRQLLEKIPEKIRVIEGTPRQHPSIQPGMTVQYRIPVRITSPTKYEWAWHQGTVEIVDEDQHLVLVTPLDEKQTWRWVSLTYVKAEAS
jgi:hypothetical protein